MSTKRTCPACNEEVLQGDEYCAHCGASLSGFWMSTWTSPPPEDRPAPPSNPDVDEIIPLPVSAPVRRHHRRSRSMIAMVAIAIILVASILVVTYIVTRGNDDGEPQPSSAGSTTIDASVGVLTTQLDDTIAASQRAPTPDPLPAEANAQGAATHVASSPTFARLMSRPEPVDIVDTMVTTIEDTDGRDNPWIQSQP